MAEDSTPAEPNPSSAGRDRRKHERLSASRVKDLSLEIAPGRMVVLQDISRGGARFQGDIRLLPGHCLALRLVTRDGLLTVKSKVLRSRLVRMAKGRVVYEAAVEFLELLPEVVLPVTAEQQPAPATVSRSSPALVAQASDDTSTIHQAETADVLGTADVPPILLTASVTHSIAELHAMLNGNEW